MFGFKCEISFWDSFQPTSYHRLLEYELFPFPNFLVLPLHVLCAFFVPGTLVNSKNKFLSFFGAFGPSIKNKTGS